MPKLNFLLKEVVANIRPRPVDLRRTKWAKGNFVRVRLRDESMTRHWSDGLGTELFAPSPLEIDATDWRIV